MEYLQPSSSRSLRLVRLLTIFRAILLFLAVILSISVTLYAMLSKFKKETEENTTAIRKKYIARMTDKESEYNNLRKQIAAIKAEQHEKDLSIVMLSKQLKQKQGINESLSRQLILMKENCTNSNGILSLISTDDCRKYLHERIVEDKEKPYDVIKKLNGMNGDLNMLRCICGVIISEGLKKDVVDYDVISRAYLLIGKSYRKEMNDGLRDLKYNYNEAFKKALEYQLLARLSAEKIEIKNDSLLHIATVNYGLGRTYRLLAKFLTREEGDYLDAKIAEKTAAKYFLDAILSVPLGYEKFKCYILAESFKLLKNPMFKSSKDPIILKRAKARLLDKNVNGCKRQLMKIK